MTTLRKITSTLPRTFLGALFALVFATPAWATPIIDKQLVVNVITLCNDDGLSCAFKGPVGNLFYEDETDKIWAQAGIDVKFVEAGTLNSTTLNSGASAAADSVGDFTGALAGPGTTMYLTSALYCTPSCTLYGEAYVNVGGLVINMGAVSAYNSPYGRIDTIAHELGHNLGIGHVDTPDPAAKSYLMHSGSGRNIPSTLADVCPDGSCYDLLPADQITLARSSDLLIDLPEPGTLVLVVAALFAAGMVRRRRA